MNGDVLARVRRLMSRLTSSELRIAQTLLADPARVSGMTITELAALCDTSLSTVARFTKSLGFSGYREFRDEVARTVTLAEAQRARFSLETTAIDQNDPVTEIAAKLVAQEAAAIEETARLIDAEAVDRVAAAIARARHVELVGQGASSLSAQDMQHKLTRIGCSAAHTPDPHLALTAVSLRSPGDVVISFSHSGETIETLRAAEVARDAGALTVAVTNAPESALVAAAELALLTYASESPFRIAAMSSRIAQLALIDILFVRIVQYRGGSVGTPLHLTHDAVARKRGAE